MIHDWADDAWAFPKLLLTFLIDHWLPLAIVVMATEVVRFSWLRLRHAWLTHDARLIEILCPPVADLAGAQAFWSNLIGLLHPAWKRALLGQPHLAMEYGFAVDGVRIQLWVPGVVPSGLVEHAIEAAWPSARTTLTDPAPPLPPGGQACGGQLMLARTESLPLKLRHEADPLRALLGAAVGLPTWQHATVQILARPATGRRLHGALPFGIATRVLRELLDFITPGRLHRTLPAIRTGADRVERLEESAQARAVRDKAGQPRYEVAVRYAVQAAEPVSADPGTIKDQRSVRRSAITGRAHAIASAFALFAGHNYLKRRRLPRAAHVLASRRLTRGYLLSVSELAALAHLPTDLAVPGLRRSGANTVAPSPAIAFSGPYAKTLGDADAGHTRPVALRVADSCHHVHVLGPNGTGKSTLIGQMVLSDVEAGRGVVVIEAKGDLITDLLGILPEQAAGKVVLIDPDDRHARPSLNVLQAADPDMATDNLVGIFHKIYADFWGPRTDDILRACCLTLARSGGTLADVPLLLTDPALRERLRVLQSGDPLLRGFWRWYDHLSDASQGQVTGPVMNKLRAFLLRPFVRDVLGSERSTIDLRSVLDGGILLVRLPKGVLGDDTARLLGSLILAQVWQAAAHRAKTGKARAPAALYVDEAHNFLTLPHALGDMLAEARAYRLSLVLAHQHLAQFPRELRQAVSSDARNKVYFSLSPEDAREVEHHFLPHLTAHDLAHLDAYQAAARLVVRAAETPPFTLRTRPLPAIDPDRARQLRLTAATAFGRTATAPNPKPDDPRLV